MKSFKEYVDLRDEGLPFNIWITGPVPLSLHHHWHEFTEILYVLEGEAFQRINSKLFKVGKGDLVVINGLELHSTYTEPGSTVNLLVIQLPPSFLSLIYRNARMYRITSNYHISTQNSKINIKIRGCVKSIIKELINKNEGFAYFLTSHLYRLMGIIFRYFATEDLNEKEYLNQKLVLERLSPVMSFIDSNFKDKISLKDAAAIAGMSPYYFCKCFKKATTYSLIEYINLLRVSYAQEMISKSGLSITEIAYQAGFSSIDYFNRVFKKITGASASKFRAR